MERIAKTPPTVAFLSLPKKRQGNYSLPFFKITCCDFRYLNG